MSGWLVSHSNGSGNCGTAGGSVVLFIDIQCTTSGTNGSTDFTATGTGTLYNDSSAYGVSSAFVGSLAIADSSNTNGANYSGNIISGITDWTKFDSNFRFWVPFTASVFPTTSHMTQSGSYTTSNNAFIWDFRTKNSNSNPLFNRSYNPSAANDAFVSGVSCPNAVNGNIAVLDKNEVPYQAWANAVEVMGDSINSPL